MTNETAKLITSRKRITRKLNKEFSKKTQYELLKEKRNEQSQLRNQQLNSWIRLRKEYKLINNRRLKIKTTDPIKNDKHIEYVRYADDWVLFSNLRIKDMMQIKQLCKTFLLEKLKLQLSEEKTKMTNIRKAEVKFLGFNIAFYNEKITTKKKFTKTIPKKLINQYRSQTTSGLIKVGLDRERITSRLMIK